MIKYLKTFNNKYKKEKIKYQIIPILFIIFFIRSKEIFNETNKTLIITNSSEYESRGEYKEETEHIIIQYNIENMEANEFSKWTSLYSAEFYNINTIGNNSFQSCSKLKTVIIGNNVITIGDFAFCLCSQLNTVVIGNNVITIGDSAFNGCSTLMNITIPNSVTTIGPRVFSECTSLNNIHVLEGNEYFKDKKGILYNKGITTIICYPLGKQNETFYIPKSIKTIGSYSFYKCSLMNITITNFVTSIETSAFEFSSKLYTIIIGENVTFIGDYAFGGCTNLKCIYFLGYESPDNIAENIFYGASTTNVMTSDLYKGDTFGSYNVIKGTPIDGCNPYRWATHTFTNSESFSQSNTYSKSNTFTLRSNTFSKSNTFISSKGFDETYIITLIFTQSITNTIIPKTLITHTISVFINNSIYSYTKTIIISYEYTVINYFSYISYYTGFYTVFYQNQNNNNQENKNSVIIISVSVSLLVVIILIVLILIILHKHQQITQKANEEIVTNEYHETENEEAIDNINLLNLSKIEEDPFANDFKENEYITNI